MNANTTAIVRKADEATREMDALKASAAKMALNPGANNAEAWGRFAIQVAEAEGKAAAWATLARMAEREHVTLSIKEVAFGLLSNGADDTWSGRGNDIKRARFDGVRAATQEMVWL